MVTTILLTRCELPAADLWFAPTRADTVNEMVWFFERNDEFLRVETRYDRDTAEFVLITHAPDGGEQTERFTDAVTFRLRLEALECQLEATHWTQHGPLFLHDGWRRT